MRGMRLILFLLLAKLNYGYINIYPTKFDKNIKFGVNETFKLYNRTNENIRYRIYVEKNKSQRIDMSDWIEVYPKSLSLKPLEEKEIRLYVNTPNNSKVGEYGATLVIKEVPSFVEDRNKMKFMTLFKLNMKGFIEKSEENQKR